MLETAKGSKGWDWQKFSYFVESPYFFTSISTPALFPGTEGCI